MRTRRVTIVLLTAALAACAASGRVAVWVSASGTMPYHLTEGARAGFTEGLEEAGLNPVSSSEVYSLNLTVDPTDAADLALLASALGCDYVAVVEVQSDGAEFVLGGRLYEGYTGELREGDTALVDEVADASRLASRIALRLADDLPDCGPLLSLGEGGATAQVALGSSDDVRRNDYGWVYRYGEPMIHPDTGENLGVGIVIVGVLRVEAVRGADVATAALSSTIGGLEYASTDRVRMFLDEDYAAGDFHRGTVVPFGELGFGELLTEEREVPLPDGGAGERGEPLAVKLSLVDVEELDYSPVALDFVEGTLAVLGDDDRVHLYEDDLTPRRSLEVDAAESLALHNGRLYLADSWSDTIVVQGLGGGALSTPETINDDLSAVLLVSGADGNLWTTTFSYSAGWDLYTYPALRLSDDGDVLEARALDDVGSLVSLAAAPDGTIYFLDNFGPVRGLTPEGDIVERGARMLREPKLLECDADGLLFVLDGTDGLVVFDEQGRVMGRWDGGGVIDLRNVDGLARGDGSCYLISNWDETLVRLELNIEYAE